MKHYSDARENRMYGKIAFRISTRTEIPDDFSKRRNLTETEIILLFFDLQVKQLLEAILTGRFDYWKEKQQ